MITNALIVLAMIAVLIFNSFLSKGYLSPIKVFVYFWGIQIILCLILFGDTVIWNYTGLIWIMVLLMACNFISVITVRKIARGYVANGKSKVKKFQPFLIKHKLSNIFLIILILVGLLYAAMLIQKYGFSIRNLFDLSKLLEMNNSIAVQRYSGTSESGVASKLLLIFVYAAPMCGGYSLFYAEDKRTVVLSIMTFIPELIVLLTENTKAPMIGCVIFFVSGWLVANMAKNGQIKKFKFKTVVIALTVAIGLVALLAMTMMLRLGRWDLNAYATVQTKMANYAFGHIPAFDNWFGNNLGDLPYSFGLQTFVGIFSFIGISARNQGIYLDNYVGGALATNVYTYFRGLVEDFGVVGSILFLLLILAFINSSYKKLSRGRNTIMNQVILMIGYSFILFPYVSLFSYNSFILAFVLFAVYLYAVQVKKKDVKRK